MRDVVKEFADAGVVANAGVSLRVDRAEVFGLLGPNGAGKTTLVRQLVGLLQPTSGEIEVFGRRVGRARADKLWISRNVAYLGQGPLPFGELTAAEAVVWTARLRGSGAAAAAKQGAALAEALHLGAFWERPLRKVSGGQRRLVQVAMALTGDLPALILDEPTTDVDPRLRREIWQLVAGRARAGTAVILVTHDIAEAEHVLDRVAILDRGRLVAAGSPRDLKAELVRRTRVEVVLGEDAAEHAETVLALFPEGATTSGSRISGWVPADEAIRTLEKITTAVGMEHLDDVRLITPTLEDVYLHASGGLSASAPELVAEARP